MELVDGDGEELVGGGILREGGGLENGGCWVGLGLERMRLGGKVLASDRAEAYCACRKEL